MNRKKILAKVGTTPKRWIWITPKVFARWSTTGPTIGEKVEFQEIPRVGRMIRGIVDKFDGENIFISYL